MFLCEFVFMVVVVLAFQGSGLHASSVLHGMVFKKETEGDVTSVKDAKIAVYSCPFDCMVTETKVSDLIRDQLLMCVICLFLRLYFLTSSSCGVWLRM